MVRRAPTERKLCASSTTTRSDRSRCSISLMPMRPRMRMSLDGTMRESFECEMTRMVASRTPCAASGAMASRCQVLTTELGESTVMRNGSSVAVALRIGELVPPLVRVVNGDRGRDVGLSETDAVAEHRAAVLLELRDEALCGLPLVGGGLVGLCLRVQRALLADHAPDVVVCSTSHAFSRGLHSSSVETRRTERAKWASTKARASRSHWRWGVGESEAGVSQWPHASPGRTWPSVRCAQRWSSISATSEAGCSRSTATTTRSASGTSRAVALASGGTTKEPSGAGVLSAITHAKGMSKWRGEVGMQLVQRLAWVAREHVVLFPPAGLRPARRRRWRQARDPQGGDCAL